jgi:hypothetical protein
MPTWREIHTTQPARGCNIIRRTCRDYTNKLLIRRSHQGLNLLDYTVNWWKQGGLEKFARRGWWRFSSHIVSGTTTQSSKLEWELLGATLKSERREDTNVVLALLKWKFRGGVRRGKHRVSPHREESRPINLWCPSGPALARVQLGYCYHYFDLQYKIWPMSGKTSVRNWAEVVAGMKNPNHKPNPSWDLCQIEKK